MVFFFLSNQGVTCCHGDILKWLWRSGVVAGERQLGKIAWEAKYERALEGQQLLRRIAEMRH